MIAAAIMSMIGVVLFSSIAFLIIHIRHEHEIKMLFRIISEQQDQIMILHRILFNRKDI